MKTLIELARKHGAEIDYSGIKGSDPANIAYEFDAKELDAYNRALVAPYVEALEAVHSVKVDLSYLDKPTDFAIAEANKDALWDCQRKALQALAAHREMFGGE